MNAEERVPVQASPMGRDIDTIRLRINRHAARAVLPILTDERLRILRVGEDWQFELDGAERWWIESTPFECAIFAGVGRPVEIWRDGQLVMSE